METTLAKQFIYNTLINDSQITGYVGSRIFDQNVPEGTGFPAIVYQLYSPGYDLISVGGYRVWSDMLYTIKVIDKNTSFANASLIANRVDQLLHKTFNQQYFVTECLRKWPYEYRESQPQVEFVHIGGVYNIKIGNS